MDEAEVEKAHWVDTGIFRRWTGSKYELPDADQKVRKQELAQLFAACKSIDWAREWRDSAAEYLLEFVETIPVDEDRSFNPPYGTGSFHGDLGQGMARIRVRQDAPEKAHDAATIFRLACSVVEAAERCANSAGTGSLYSALYDSFRLGEAVARCNIRQYEPDVLKSKRYSQSQSDRAKKGRLTLDQWGKVCEFIKTKTSDDRCSAAQACEMASKQLRTGTFSGIPSSISIEKSALQKRWSQRNK